MDLNRVSLIGNLTRDPELKEFDGNKKCCLLGIATNSRWKDSSSNEVKNHAVFHDAVAWGNLGEICSKYLKKGRKVYLEGKLNNKTWTDSENVKHYKTEINAQNIIILDNKFSKDDVSSNEVIESEDLGEVIVEKG